MLTYSLRSGHFNWCVEGVWVLPLGSSLTPIINLDSVVPGTYPAVKSQRNAPLPVPPFPALDQIPALGSEGE